MYEYVVRECSVRIIRSLFVLGTWHLALGSIYVINVGTTYRDRVHAAVGTF